LAPRGEDRPEAEERVALTDGALDLRGIVGATADGSVEDEARVLEREIVLAEVEPVGPREPRDVRPIVEHEGHAAPTGPRRELAGELERRPIVLALVA